MPPENVRYPPTHRARNYIKNTLPKCYNPGPKASEIKENMTKKNGYSRLYLTKDLGLYRGWWKNNMRDGMGTQIDRATKEIYEGEFHEDKRSGYGVTSRMRPNGMQDLLYEGTFAYGAPNGTGELHTDTYHFKGKVYNGKASGVGIGWYKNGTIYFGSWFNGKRMGQGMQVHKNKNRYEGNWYDDKKHGYGQYCFFDRGQALEGIWVADVCVRGTLRNIKYRQAATDPVKYAVPTLMLKDWTSCYYRWEQEALARVGKYIREDLGIKDNLMKEGSEKCTVKPPHNDMKQNNDNLEREIDLLQLNLYTKFPAVITEVQPCVIFR